MSIEDGQITFLRRCVPRWFMKPLTSQDGSAMRKGSANEEGIIRSLKQYVYSFSNGKYKVMDIQTFGYFIRQDTQVCSSSPDAIFALLERQEDNDYLFAGLCVLEIKTHSALGKVDDLYRMALNGNKFTECCAGTPLFKRCVPDPPYRSQICQHATAIVNRVLLVYSVPGALPQKMVLVTVSNEQQATLKSLQQILAERYLKFCYDSQAAAEIPELGEDYSLVYGYAQTHECLELWLNVWREFSNDAVKHGTAPKVRRFIDLPTSFWNKCMGNVDAVRRSVREAMAVRGPDSGPGSLLWFSLFDYILVQAHCHYQHAKIETALDRFSSFKQFKMERRRTNSYRSYLRKLLKSLSPESIEDHFPGLRQRIDYIKCGTTPKIHNMTLRTPVDMVQQEKIAGTAKPLPAKKVLWIFLDPESEWFRKRLNPALGHGRAKSSKAVVEISKEGCVTRRSDRGSCIVCCARCDARSNNPGGECKGKKGRKTTYYCRACEVYVCEHCWDTFHNDELPELPPCVAKRAGLKSQKKPPFATACKTRPRVIALQESSFQARRTSTVKRLPRLGPGLQLQQEALEHS